MEKDSEEKQEKKTEKKTEKKEVKSQGGRAFFGWGSFLLLVALIIIVLIVFQVPYTSTNVIKENVLVEKCAPEAMPFVSNFRMGLNYEGAQNVYSSEGKALYRYSELNNYIYSNIRNLGEEKGIYCLDVQAYLIDDFDFSEGEDSLVLFNSLLEEESDSIGEIDNWNSGRYTLPVCTENAIRPVDTTVLSLWTPSLLSKEAKEEYDLDDVYILFSIVPPTSEKCAKEYEERTTEEDVTKYCNAWKHLVGRC